MPAPPLEVRNVTKCFGDIAAVRELSFALEPGTITGFLGPNGAGKSTTLRMVGGLLRPTAGEVSLFGVAARDPRARTTLGYMPADPAFLPHLTGRDNLELLAGLRGGADDDVRRRAAGALALTDTDLSRRVGGYSSGMRQKLSIVAAVQHRPTLIVLDEPANRLDPIAHHSFCELMRDLAMAGHTVLLSSHVLAEVEAVCEFVLLVREGALLKSATVAQLRENAPRVVTVARADGTTSVTHVAAERPDLLRGLLADPDVVDLTVVPASLEDVVLSLYTGSSTP